MDQLCRSIIPRDQLDDYDIKTNGCWQLIYNSDKFQPITINHPFASTYNTIHAGIRASHANAWLCTWKFIFAYFSHLFPSDCISY